MLNLPGFSFLPSRQDGSPERQLRGESDCCAGRGEEMVQRHIPIVDPVLALVDSLANNRLSVKRRFASPFVKAIILCGTGTPVATCS